MHEGARVPECARPNFPTESDTPEPEAPVQGLLTLWTGLVASRLLGRVPSSVSPLGDGARRPTPSEAECRTQARVTRDVTIIPAATRRRRARPRRLGRPDLPGRNPAHAASRSALSRDWKRDAGSAGAPRAQPIRSLRNHGQGRGPTTDDHGFPGQPPTARNLVSRASGPPPRRSSQWATPAIPMSRTSLRRLLTNGSSARRPSAATLPPTSPPLTERST